MRWDPDALDGLWRAPTPAPPGRVGSPLPAVAPAPVVAPAPPVVPWALSMAAVGLLVALTGGLMMGGAPTASGSIQEPPSSGPIAPAPAGDAVLVEVGRPEEPSAMASGRRSPELEPRPAVEAPSAPDVPEPWVIRFGFDEAEATWPREQVLAMSRCVGEVEVVGHASPSGPEAYNLHLSRQRAEAVAARLLDARPGLSVRVRGAGTAEPLLGPQGPKPARDQRRVEVRCLPVDSPPSSGELP